MEDEQWHVGPSLTVTTEGITDVEIRMVALQAAVRMHGARNSSYTPYYHQIIADAKTFERYLRGDDA